MSEIYNSFSEHKLDAGISVDIAEESLERAQLLLAGIKGGWKQAVGSALARAAAAGKTAVKTQVSQDYTISQSLFLSQTRTYNHFKGETTVVFGYRSNVIPLMKFHTQIGQDGRIITEVKRAIGSKALDRAFTARVGNHYGVFERVGRERYPIRELYGPSTVQMMYSDESVADAAETAMAETFEKRIDHEISRVLNGFGVRW